MARILALALNDPTAEAPTPTPDPTSETADAIFKGDDVDVIEIDAASNTGVDNVRDLIENARFRPMRSRFKIYIIDEVHMLSKAAFNALLKIMEEPPSHVKFILATTEPEKVLPTILSRVQRFDFRNIASNDIVGHLQAVVTSEGRTASDDALALVARNGQGSMRDSLSLLDRLLGGLDASDTLDIGDVTRLLGLPPREQIADLIDGVAEGDAKAVLAQADSMLSGGLASDAFIGSLVEHVHVLLVRSVVGDGEGNDLPGVTGERLDEQAERFDQAGMTQAVVILEELRRQLRGSGGGGTGRALIDATLVRLALARQFTPVDDLMAAASGAASRQPAEKKTADIKPARRPLPEREAPAPRKAEPEGSGTADPARREPVAADATPPGSAPPSDVTLTPAPSPEVTPPSASGDSPLSQLVAALNRGGARDASLVAESRLEVAADGAVTLRYAHEHSMFPGMLERHGTRPQIVAALREVLSLEADPPLAFEVDEAPEAGDEEAQERETKRPRIKKPPIPTGDVAMPTAPNAPPPELDWEADPLVRAAMRELGARVVKVEDA